jgi:hypothetical protein
MFKVPESKGSTPEGQFEFELAGTVYRIPKLDYLTGEQMMLAVTAEEAATRREQVDALFGLFETVCDAPVRSLAMDQIGELYQAWVGAGSITPGESESSATSSQSTEQKLSTNSSAAA